MKMYFSPAFWSLVEAERPVILYLQLSTILDPEGAAVSEEELRGKRLNSYL